MSDYRDLNGSPNQLSASLKIFIFLGKIIKGKYLFPNEINSIQNKCEKLFPGTIMTQQQQLFGTSLKFFR